MELFSCLPFPCRTGGRKKKYKKKNTSRSLAADCHQTLASRRAHRQGRPYRGGLYLPAGLIWGQLYADTGGVRATVGKKKALVISFSRLLAYKSRGGTQIFNVCGVTLRRFPGLTRRASMHGGHEEQCKAHIAGGRRHRKERAPRLTSGTLAPSRSYI